MSFETFGDFLLAVRAAELQPGRPDSRLFRRGAAGSSEAVPAEGGFLVAPDYTRALIERMYMSGGVLSRCMEMPISAKGNGITFPQFDENDRRDGSRFGGVRAYWANEADSAIATKPKFMRCELIAKKLLGFAYCTEELFNDAAALEIFVSMALMKELTFKLEDALINGDGSGKPLGIMRSGALITVAKQSGQAAATVVAGNITDMWRRCWAASRPTAVWLAHPDAEAQCIGLTAPVGTGGSAIPLYVATTNPENQPYNLMLGRPVISMEQTQVPGTPGDIILADFSRVVVAMKETRADVSMHIQFLSDQMAFRVVMRVDAMPVDAYPITPYSGTDTVSPFLAIAQRS
jgi:HK97 family phage major capsid protein